MTSIQRTPYDALKVVRLGRAEWRVSESSEQARLLGFIERQRRDRFEILWVTEPLRWGYAESFDSALVAFADAPSFTGEIAHERTRTSRAPRIIDHLAAVPSGGFRSTWSGDIAEH